MFRNLSICLLIFLGIFNSVLSVKISIITSVYKGGEFIEGFMEDITSQTIFNKKDWFGNYFCELIMVDANSPHNEKETIKKYCKKYKNIRYIKLEKDPGLYGVWNYAIGISKGEYITNANLDDRLAANSIEEHYKYLCKHPDIDIVYADTYWTPIPNQNFIQRNNGQKTYQQALENEGYFSGSYGPFDFENLLKGNTVGNHPMWRKSIHSNVGMFNTKYFSAGDFEMWCRCISFNLKISKMPGVLGVYYKNPKGISTNEITLTRAQKEVFEISEMYKIVLSNLYKNKKLEIKDSNFVN